MIQRFFKLLYVLSLISIGLSLPIYLLATIQFDAIIRTSYKARCLSNDKYVVLQGAQYNQAYEFDEFVLNSPLSPELDIKKTLNFYCKYYDAIQPHITAYIESKNSIEERNANISFVEFEKSVISTISSFPPLYRLEITTKETQPYEIFGPIINWFIGAIFAFLLLQIVKICYLYVIFGEIVLHPFRKKKNSRFLD